MGLEKTQGLYFADSRFWTRDAEARRWAKRFFSRQQQVPYYRFASTMTYVRCAVTAQPTIPAFCH